MKFKNIMLGADIEALIFAALRYGTYDKMFKKHAGDIQGEALDTAEKELKEAAIQVFSRTQSKKKAGK